MKDKIANVNIKTYRGYLPRATREGFRLQVHRVRLADMICATLSIAGYYYFIIKKEISNKITET